MSFISRIAVTFLCLFTMALADVQIGTLQASYTTSQTMTITWTDSGSSPTFAQLTTATILICTGSNAEIQCFGAMPLGSGIAVANGQLSVALSTIEAVGGDGPYFIQITALDGTSGNTIHYSNRFTMSGMTGTIAATSGGDTTPPAAQINIALDPSQQSLSILVPYTLQTGPTRYAPMQLQPGTTVTRPLSAVQRLPTSAVTLYKSAQGSPNVMTTLTPGWSYVFSSMTNYAPNLPSPTAFYQASAALASSIEAVPPTKRRRWMD